MLEFIASLFFELIIVELLRKLIGLKFKMVYLIGITLIKTMTLSDEPMNTLALVYKDSIIPYILGFSVLIFVGILISIFIL